MNVLPVLQSACCPGGSGEAVPDVATCAAYAACFKALADPARVALVARLGGGDEVCVCHLVEGSGLSQPTISHHLAILKRAGLVTSTRRGTWSYYKLVPDAIRDLAEALTIPSG
jgi:ArsR family transcriptional regulator, arsenate/arsenite/antimonite-responsive transcriptional repressor